ncbi:MAG: transporter associated domain-containing protein [Steroidobacteraceae bacterium]
MNRPTQPTGTWLKKLTRALSGEAQDRDDLINWLRDAGARGVIESDALAMLEGVLEVGDIQVREIMVPRAQMVVVHRDDPPEKLVSEAVESGHSRFPVMNEDRDNIVGILLAKDLLRLHMGDNGERFDIREFMRPAAFVPESKRVNVLLREFRHSHNHMAIVVDEYGGVAGLVTIEDVIEQIIGEIDDEHDVDEDQNIRKEGERQFTVRGQTPIEEFNEYFSTDLSDEEFDTVAGLVMQQLGRLPRRGESVHISEFELKVVRADRRRIDLLRLVTPRDVIPPEDRPLDGSG